MQSTIIYTDGSASKNGSTTATGGIGVFFSNENPKNVSQETKQALKELLPDYKLIKITNNISELTAILKALVIMKGNLEAGEKIIIKTDSMYCINSLTKWYKNWEKNNWKNSSNKPVLNKELIKCIIDTYIKIYPDQINFTYVRAHTKPPLKSSPSYSDFWGNFMADNYATNFN